MSSLVEAVGIEKTFVSETERLAILNGVDLTVDHGETVSITGESGSGKSTLLHLIGGLDHVSGGSVRIDGADITDMDETALSYFRNRTIGFIFQSHFLLEEFSAVENVMIPYLMHTFNKKEAYQKAEELLCLVGLQSRMKHHPSKMSGGERQRVAIARAFINDPPLIVADEPTGNLDTNNADKVIDLLFNITHEKKHALILVTHSAPIAHMASRHYDLQHGRLILADRRDTAR